MSTPAQIRFVTRQKGQSFSEHPPDSTIHAQLYRHYDGNPGSLGLAIVGSSDKTRQGAFVKATKPKSVSENTNMISQGHQVISIYIEGDKPTDVSKFNKKETMDVLKKQLGDAKKAKKSLVLEFKDFQGKISSEISIDVAKGEKSKPIQKKADASKSTPKKKKNIFGW